MRMNSREAVTMSLSLILALGCSDKASDDAPGEGSDPSATGGSTPGSGGGESDGIDEGCSDFSGAWSQVTAHESCNWDEVSEFNLGYVIHQDGCRAEVVLSGGTDEFFKPASSYPAEIRGDLLVPEVSDPLFAPELTLDGDQLTGVGLLANEDGCEDRFVHTATRFGAEYPPLSDASPPADCGSCALNYCADRVLACNVNTDCIRAQACGAGCSEAEDLKLCENYCALDAPGQEQIVLDYLDCLSSFCGSCVPWRAVP